MDVVGCWVVITDNPSSNRLAWCREGVKFCTIDVGVPELLITVVMAVDNGILPRIWSCCSDDIKGEGMVRDVFEEEYLPPSKMDTSYPFLSLKFNYISKCISVYFASKSQTHRVWFHNVLPANKGVGEKFWNLLPFGASIDGFDKDADFFFLFCLAPWPLAWSLLTIRKDAEPL